MNYLKEPRGAAVPFGNALTEPRGAAVPFGNALTEPRGAAVPFGALPAVTVSTEYGTVSTAKQQAAPNDKILGLSKPVFYGLAAVVVAGGLYFALAR